MKEPELDAKVRIALDKLTAARVPHAKFLMALTIALLTCFGTVSLIVLLNNYDGLTKGLIIGTWNSLAVGTFSFWMGSSSGGKSKDNVK